MSQRNNKKQRTTSAYMPSGGIVGIPREPKYTATSRQNPVPMRLLTNLRYTDTFTQALPVGPGFVDFQFSMNSLFDPNVTGTGHQPKGFDQLAALYNKYRVFRVHYRCVVLLDHVTPWSIKLVAAPTNSNSALSGIDSAAEQWGATQADGTTSVPAMVTGTVDLAELNGKSRFSYAADDTTAANVTASPTELLNLHVCAANFTGLAQNVYYDVSIIYECEFSDPNQLGQS